MQKVLKAQQQLGGGCADVGASDASVTEAMLLGAVLGTAERLKQHAAAADADQKENSARTFSIQPNLQVAVEGLVGAYSYSLSVTEKETDSSGGEFFLISTSD